MNRNEIIIRMRSGAIVTQTDSPFNGSLHTEYAIDRPDAEMIPLDDNASLQVPVPNKVFEKLINQHKVEQGAPVYNSESNEFKTSWKWKGGVI